jgi:adenosylhomocysteinase
MMTEEEKRMKDYEIRDISLAPSGRQRIEWVRHNMPLLTGLKEMYGSLPAGEKPFAGLRISLSIHLEPKTAYLCETLAAAGASMSVTGCNPLSTQDDTAAALAESGMRVYAVHGESEADYFRHIEMALEHRPHIVIDDGGDLAACLHGKRPDLAEEVLGGGEETTTGIIRLKALARDGRLLYPVVAVNDARCKHLFDNRYGTGQSVWDSVLRNTNLIVASKTVVVAGYGWCGRGIAMRAAALGAQVIVTEIDPVKAIEARMDGYAVMTMREAAPLGDIIISATGCKDVVTLGEMELMKDRVILGNAGHFNVEVDVEGLAAAAERSYEARGNITAYVLPGGKTVHVLAEGRLLNIAAADGHPAEIMDMSFAVQFLSAMYIKDNHADLPRDVVDVSREIDMMVAERKLAAWGLEIDRLSPEQERYLSSWDL